MPGLGLGVLVTDTRVADRYEPLEVIGRGGEATVLKAIDTRHERLVALKVRVVPNGGSADDLLIEARALLTLPPHPGLVHARDDLFDEGRHVLVLDWVEGVNLARLLADEGRPGLPVSSVLRWIAQAAEALTVLHQHGVVHGDVKPANLILDRDGRIVLVDLGSSSVPATEAARGGTPGFRAPEIASGAPADRSSDVFGLAATAFTLLTGTPPTGGRPAWTGVPADVADRLEGALRPGLAIDPARRPATPGELVERLRAGWDDQTPTGVATVLLTDVVDSSRLWEQTPQRVPALLAEMQLVIDRNVEDHGGRRIGATVEGDATVSVFPSAVNAVIAAIGLQRSLAGRSDALQVRAGLATGEIVPVDGDVLGPTLNRAARVRDLARAGEILLASSTAEVVRLASRPGLDLMALGPSTTGERRRSE
jgi:serine/threonine protein kinase